MKRQSLGLAGALIGAALMTAGAAGAGTLDPLSVHFLQGSDPQDAAPAPVRDIRVVIGNSANQGNKGTVNVHSCKIAQLVYLHEAISDGTVWLLVDRPEGRIQNLLTEHGGVRGSQYRIKSTEKPRFRFFKPKCRKG